MVDINWGLSTFAISIVHHNVLPHCVSVYGATCSYARNPIFRPDVSDIKNVQCEAQWAEIPVASDEVTRTSFHPFVDYPLQSLISMFWIILHHIRQKTVTTLNSQTAPMTIHWPQRMKIKWTDPKVCHNRKAKNQRKFSQQTIFHQWVDPIIAVTPRTCNC